MSEDAPNILEKARRRADSIIESRPAYEEMINFNMKIFETVKKAAEKNKNKVSGFDRKKAEKAIHAGKHVFEELDISFDFSSAGSTMTWVLETLKNSGGEVAGNATRLLDEQKFGGFDTDKFLESMLSEGAGDYIQDLAGRLEVDPMLLRLLAESSMRPLFEELSNLVKNEVDLEEWKKPSCPVCGNRPYISELRGKEGKRYLVCPMCGTDWQYTRMECVNCGNSEQDTLRFIYHEDVGLTQRAEVCDECKYYIKLLDYRDQSEPIIPEIEDWGTLHLDIMAEEQGYNRGQ